MRRQTTLKKQCINGSGMTVVRARSQNYENRLLTSSCPPAENHMLQLNI